MHGIFVALLTGVLMGWCGESDHDTLVPEDYGSAEIDVSNYPLEYQKTYENLFLPVFGFLRETTRTVNSSWVEMDAHLEKIERKNNPELFSDPSYIQASSNIWKKKVEAIRLRPPCCGACPVLSLKEARSLWKFLVYDSLVRKMGPNARRWIAQRRSLLEKFQARNLKTNKKQTLGGSL